MPVSYTRNLDIAWYSEAGRIYLQWTMPIRQFENIISKLLKLNVSRDTNKIKIRTHENHKKRSA